MRRARSIVGPALAALAVFACGGPSASPASTTGTGAPATTHPDPTVSGDGRLRYVALGDSYTIGTSVAEPERWPNQLVEVVPDLELVANLAVNGFTSRDVIEVQTPQLPALDPDFVTLLIGVNDVVQGVPANTYRQNVGRLLNDLTNMVGPDRVLVVTTPDYTVTPAGADYGDPATRAAGIRANNAIITEVARSFGVDVVDIHDLSLRAAGDRSLVAPDGLHPSGAQYALWVERIAPAVLALLETEGS